MKLYPNIVYIFTAWLVSILLVSFIGFSTLPHSNKSSENFFKSFANWDGGHFLGIAEHGYSEKFQYAFFPLYPLAIKLLNQITGNYLLAALLISTVASFLGIQLLYKLVALDFDKQSLPTGKKVAEKVVLAILFFPASFFFLTAYSEGLFFFLVVAAFYCFRKRKIFWATVFALFASATRLAGLALVLGLLAEVLVTTGFNRKNIILLLSPLGFLVYCWYLYTQTGDPFYFITAERHWQRVLSIPGLGFWETIRNLTTPNFISQYPYFLTDLIFAVFGVGMVFRSFRFLPKSFAIYSLISVSLPMFTPLLSSMPRFLLPIFPIFILIALVRNKYAIFVYQLVSVMLLGLFVTLFINGYWVS